MLNVDIYKQQPEAANPLEAAQKLMQMKQEMQRQAPVGLLTQTQPTLPQTQEALSILGAGQPYVRR